MKYYIIKHKDASLDAYSSWELSHIIHHLHLFPGFKLFSIAAVISASQFNFIRSNIFTCQEILQCHLNDSHKDTTR